MEPTQPHPDTAVIIATAHREHEYDEEEEDEYNENELVPDLEKDDMMARRTGTFQKPSVARANQSINQFLPVPGSVKYSIAPVSVMKPLNSRPKLTEKMADERYSLCLMDSLLCWSAVTTNQAYFTYKDEGLIVLTSYLALVLILITL